MKPYIWKPCWLTSILFTIAGDVAPTLPSFSSRCADHGPFICGQQGAVDLSEDKLQALSTEIRDKLVGVALDLTSAHFMRPKVFVALGPDVVGCTAASRDSWTWKSPQGSLPA